MKIKVFLLVLLVMFFISCDDKATNYDDVSGLKEHYVFKGKYDRETIQIRFKGFDHDWNNDGTTDWGDGSNLPSSWPPDSLEPPASSEPPVDNPNKPEEEWVIGYQDTIEIHGGETHSEYYFDRNLAKGLDPLRTTQVDFYAYRLDGSTSATINISDTLSTSPPNDGIIVWNIQTSGPDQSVSDSPYYDDSVSNIDLGFSSTGIELVIPYRKQDGTLVTYYWEGPFQRDPKIQTLTLVRIEEEGQAARGKLTKSLVNQRP